jgi:hypothetical protein
MNVITHQAEGMDAVPESLSAALKQKEKAGTIRLIEKSVLAIVSAKDDVVDSTWKMNARFSGHNAILQGFAHLSSLTPKTYNF